MFCDFFLATKCVKTRPVVYQVYGVVPLRMLIETGGKQPVRVIYHQWGKITTIWLVAKGNRLPIYSIVEKLH